MHRNSTDNKARNKYSNVTQEHGALPTPIKQNAIIICIFCYRINRFDVNIDDLILLFDEVITQIINNTN